jgi:hypothetical protein
MSRRDCSNRSLTLRRLLPLLAVAGLPLFALQSAAPVRASSSPPHVMVVMLENRGYAGTLGACASDPYLCSLVSRYAGVTGWTGVTHPSLPNYLATTTGSTQGCSSDVCFGPFAAPSLGGQLTAAGVPWAAYMESMPSSCYAGQWAPSGSSAASALYAEKHDPFVTATDVLGGGCAQHVLPYPGAAGLSAALSGGGAPDFVWITPNQQNDMHTGSVQAGDAWLSANIAPVLASPWFTGGNATVVITMDEDEGSNIGGGGQVPMVVISSASKGKGNIALNGNHFGTLRSVERVYGLPLLGAAAQAGNGDLTALFSASTTRSSSPPPHFSPQGVGQPSVAVDSHGTQLVFWQGAGHHLVETWWNGRWNGPVDWTAASGWAPTVDSAPSVTITPSGTQMIFWAGPGGHLYEAWYAGAWNGPIDWTASNHWVPSMTSAPSVTVSNGTQLVFWQGPGGHLDEAWWNGSWNGPVDWTVVNRWTPSVSSAPSVVTAGTSQLVFWRGPTGHLVEAWWTGGWNGPVDWTAGAFHGAALLSSAPTAMVTTTGKGAQMIVWQGARGHLFEAWYAGGWNGPVDVTGSYFGNMHPATSAPTVAMDGSTQMIFWQAAGGHLSEAWWSGSWNGPVDWSA